MRVGVEQELNVYDVQMKDATLRMRGINGRKEITVT